MASRLTGPTQVSAPRRGHHQRKDRDPRGSGFSFFDAVGKYEIARAADEIHRHARIGAQQDKLKRKRQLARRLEEHNFFMIVVLIGDKPERRADKSDKLNANFEKHLSASA